MGPHLMDPNAALAASFLAELGLDFRLDEARAIFVVNTESQLAEPHVIVLAVQDNTIRFEAKLLEAEKIPDAARAKLCEVLLTVQPEGYSHYSIDTSGNVILRVTVPTSGLTRDTIFR